MKNSTFIPEGSKTDLLWNPEWEEEIDLRALFELLRSYWYWLLIGLIVGALAGWVGSVLQVPLYEANTQVLVTRGSADSGVLDFTQSATLRELLATYQELLKKEWFHEEVVARLGIESLDPDRIRVTQATNTLVLEIVVRDPDPQQAARIADTFVQVLIEQNNKIQASRYAEAEQRLESQITATEEKVSGLRLQLQKSAPDSEEQSRLQAELAFYQQLYLELLDRLETLRLQKAQNMPNVIQIVPAIPSDKPVWPRTLLNILLASLLGVVLAITAVLLRQALDITVKAEDVENLEKTMNLTVVGQIPVPPSPLNENVLFPVLREPRSPLADAYRVMRTNLDFMMIEQPLRSLVVGSVAPEDGKSTTVINLAAVFSHAGKKVVLVDTDLHRPRLHRYLKIPNRVGLTDVIRGAISPEKAITEYKDGATAFFVLPSGGLPPNPTDLLGSKQMGQLVAWLRERFDLVIFDAPPGILSDGLVISRQTDGLLVVARAGKTSKRELQSLLTQYQRTGIRVLGLVLRDVPHMNGYYHYYYGSERRRRGEKVERSEEA